MQVVCSRYEPITIPFNDVFAWGFTLRRQVSCLIEGVEADGALSESASRISLNPGWRGYEGTSAPSSSRSIRSTLKPCSAQPASRVSLLSEGGGLLSPTESRSCSGAGKPCDSRLQSFGAETALPESVPFRPTKWKASTAGMSLWDAKPSRSSSRKWEELHARLSR